MLLWVSNINLSESVVIESVLNYAVTAAGAAGAAAVVGGVLAPPMTK